MGGRFGVCEGELDISKIWNRAEVLVCYQSGTLFYSIVLKYPQVGECVFVNGGCLGGNFRG